MAVVVLKLVLAPLLIAFASLVARRWGPSVRAARRDVAFQPA